MSDNDSRGFDQTVQARTPYFFELTETITGTAPDRKAKGKIFRLSPGSAPVLSTREYDFYDMIGDLSGVSGNKGYAILMADGKFHILTLEC